MISSKSSSLNLTCRHHEERGEGTLRGGEGRGGPGGCAHGSFERRKVGKGQRGGWEEREEGEGYRVPGLAHCRALFIPWTLTLVCKV